MKESKMIINKSNYNELLLGCGSRKHKQMHLNGKSSWENLVTLDNNADHQPDVVWDLHQMPLPFEDNSFDEIHAYEVLEHLGTQGDYQFFFNQFSDFWRILKPNGVFAGTCPMANSIWAFGDPSHTRVIQKENFIFLDQSQYTTQIGKTAMSDFRYLYQADFNNIHISEKDGTLRFALVAIKPSRLSINHSVSL